MKPPATSITFFKFPLYRVISPSVIRILLSEWALRINAGTRQAKSWMCTAVCVVWLSRLRLSATWYLMTTLFVLRRNILLSCSLGMVTAHGQALGCRGSGLRVLNTFLFLLN